MSKSEKTIVAVAVESGTLYIDKEEKESILVDKHSPDLYWFELGEDRLCLDKEAGEWVTFRGDSLSNSSPTPTDSTAIV